ncbi:hypothetical protein RJ639_002455, partial [Escallonia herrerae]
LISPCSLLMQWPGSYFDTKQIHCYPKTGKPATEFMIQGLWPHNFDNTYPSNCSPHSPYNPSKISDLLSRMQKSWPSFSCPSSNGSSLWSHEWEQYGTCSGLDQTRYFKSALDLRDHINLFHTLKNAGIKPDGKLYSTFSISEAIRGVVGYIPGIMCNSDASGIRQLHQIYICIDPSASKAIDCPGLPDGQCASEIKFSSF